jgi:hypothetical protein
MTRITLGQFDLRLLRRLVSSGALVLCLAALGCTSTGLRGTSYMEDDFSTLPKSYRRAELQSSPTAYSNKAKQIESNLGI